jgi:hypothetical protein
MKTITRALLMTFAISIAFLATACPQRTDISRIESDPAQFANKEVAVAGTVQNGYGGSIPFIKNGSGGIYKIDDGTGSIWVLTQKSVPSKGAQLGVKGKIQNGMTIGGKNYGLVLVEDDRKFANK